MKKLVCLFSMTLNVILLFALTAQAQHQRLGISPQPAIYLNSQKQVAEVEAFCLDRHKIIDGRYDYHHVLASNGRTVVTVGSRRLTLQKAIDEKLIKVSGQTSRVSDSGVMSLRFERFKTNLPVKIEILEALAMGENPGRFRNSRVLTSLKNPAGTSRASKQDEIWAADIDNSRLESLGYTSVEEFQRANNLPVNGLDPVTKAQLQKAEAALVSRFESVDLAEPRYDTSVKSVSDNIRKFQRAIREEVTGVFSPDVRAQFEQYEKIDFPVIKELKEYNSYPSTSLILRVRSSIGDDNLYTVYSHYGKIYEGNSVSEISNAVSREASGYEKVYLDLDLPSRTKVDGFKTSFDIAQIKSRLTLIEGNPSTKTVLFSTKRSFEIENVTEPILESGAYSSTIGLRSTNAVEVNKRWKVRAASKVRETLIKFTDAFRSRLGLKEKLSLADVIERARVADEARRQKLDVTVSFIDEFGEIQLGKLLFVRPIQITAE